MAAIKQSPKILDCTLRDGGYYGNWDFDKETVLKYLAAMAMAKVDIIEIGFRFLPQNKFLGAFAYSTDEYISSLPLPEEITIAVMVNAGELLTFTEGPEAAIDQLFTPCNMSPVDLVRVATHIRDLPACRGLVSQLKTLGYQVAINLMQAANLDNKDLEQHAAQVAEWDVVDILYFADSFGNMNPTDIKDMVSSLRKEWSGTLGIHAHDNKGQALANCVAAIESGVSFVDSTVLGMGRGAGNTRTENLLVELTQRGFETYYPDAVFPLVLHEFKRLQKHFCWGPNLYYYLSATYGIHPTYIQEMLGDNRYSTEHILGAVDFLRNSGAPSFSFEIMLRAITGKNGSDQGSWDATGWVADRDVLIIGPGPGSSRHIEALQQYVKRANPVVLCLNVNDSVPSEMVTAYVACHETRILIEADRYSSLGKPLLIPTCRIPDALQARLGDVDVWDYGLRVQDDSFAVGSHGCVLSSPLAIAYTLAIIHQGGAKRILLAGFDGYAAGDPRQEEMINVLDQYWQLDNHIPIVAVTSSTYPITSGSIYEPGL